MGRHARRPEAPGRAPVKKKRKRSRAGRTARKRLGSGRIQADDVSREDEPLKEKILRGRRNEGVAPEEASATELAGEVRRGRVISIRGSEATVDPEDGSGAVVTALRKSTRVPHSGSALVVGDFVDYLAEGEPPFVLTEVHPRRTVLTRVRRGDQEHAICANVDLGVIVASAAEPPFKPRLVDRYLVSVRDGGLEPVLVLNKIDLATDVEVSVALAPYHRLPFPALAVSAETGDGIDELIDVLRDRVSVFSGQSGVGKSSLLNRLAPDLEIRTSDVHKKTGKGRHTTTASTLYRFPFGGSVIDTPGVKGFLLHEPSLEATLDFFPEIAEVIVDCRFTDCSHQGDEGCAVPAAVKAGRIDPDRLDSFLVLRSEIDAR